MAKKPMIVLKLNKKDKIRLATMKEFLPDGCNWPDVKTFYWFSANQHDLKAIPEKMIKAGKGKEVTAYIKETFVDKKTPKKEPKKKKERPPKAPKKKKK